MKDKPLAGGSGKASLNKGHGKKILNALFDMLAEVEDPAMSDLELLTLLAEAQDRAAKMRRTTASLGRPTRPAL